MTFADDIEQVAGSEPIEAIVIEALEGSWRTYGTLHERLRASAKIGGKVVSWAEARPYLDYDYDSGYGSQDCHSITAWTATRVLFVEEYDGATGVTSVPRHPVEHEPQSI